MNVNEKEKLVDEAKKADDKQNALRDEQLDDVAGGCRGIPAGSIDAIEKQFKMGKK